MTKIIKIKSVDHKLTSLLFVDNMVIIGHSTLDLQQHLISNHEYCNLVCLETSIVKTKVGVFRKRGPVRADELRYYNNKPLDAVAPFN